MSANDNPFQYYQHNVEKRANEKGIIKRMAYSVIKESNKISLERKSNYASISHQNNQTAINYKKENRKFKREQANIVVMIPMYKRHNVIKKVFKSLHNQTYPCKILVIVSTTSDKNLCINEGVDYCFSINKPLGNKYLTGIYECKKYNPKAIIVLGSDDLLSKKYVEEAFKSLKGSKVGLVGTSKWFIFSSEKEVYSSVYTNKSKHKTVGAGRMYSREFLDKVKWNIFDSSLNNGLDLKGEVMTRRHNYKIIIMKKDAYVFSIKGNWNMLHTMDDIIKNSHLIVLTRMKRGLKLLNKYLGPNVWK